MRLSRPVERQHPLSSPIALVSSLILLAGLALGLVTTGGRAFSPGDLSAVAVSDQRSGGFDHHAAFADDCTACHAPARGIAADRCTACHTPIADARAAGTGLHGNAGADDCTLCHSEHQGADYDLQGVALAAFSAEDHAILFPLDGAHAEQECADCHAADRYAGTGRLCADCHSEPAIHAGLFGTTCADCHTTTAWQPAELVRHTFPLDHGDEDGIGLPCTVCHSAALTAYTCANCHDADAMRDEHDELALSAVELAACADCHPDGREDGAPRALPTTHGIED